MDTAHLVKAGHLLARPPPRGARIEDLTSGEGQGSGGGGEAARGRGPCYFLRVAALPFPPGMLRESNSGLGSGLATSRACIESRVELCRVPDIPIGILFIEPLSLILARAVASGAFALP